MSKLSFWRTICSIYFICVLRTISSSAQTFTILHSFDETHGGNPVAALLQATDGNLYGTAQVGGPNFGDCYFLELDGCGTVFKITPGGKLTTLYDFCSQNNCADGGFPYAGLVQAPDTNFYGTNWGCYNGCSAGSGTVFKITPAGKLTTLYSFCSQTNCTDGSSSTAALIRARDGYFYGTTSLGGAQSQLCPVVINYCGTVFKITPAGKLTTLYSFLLAN